MCCDIPACCIVADGSTRKLVVPIYYFHANLTVVNEIMLFKTFVYCDVERKVSFLPGF